MVLVCLILGLTHAYYFTVHHQIDDAYITFRYSQNLTAGYGLVFNPGEKLEATSSILWAILLTPFEIAGVGAPTGAVVLGLLFYAATMVSGSYLLITILGPESKIISVAMYGMLLASSSSFALWSVYGMENSLVALLLIGNCLALHEKFRGSRLLSIGPTCLLPIARPEGLFFVPLFIILRTLKWITSDDAHACRDFRAWLFGVITVIGFFEIWRLFYYGHFLPNTVAVKAPTLIDAHKIYYGIRYLLHPVNMPSMGLLVFGLIFLYYSTPPLLGKTLFSRWVLEQPKRCLKLIKCIAHENLPLMAVVGVIFWQIGFVVMVGGDWMPNGRFVSHIIPLICILFVYATRNASFVNSISLSIIVVVLACYVGSNMLISKKISNGVLRKYDSSVEQQKGVVAITNFLNSEATDLDTVAASDIGYLGYHFRGRVLDWWGLANYHIASAGQSSGKINPLTIVSMSPKYVILYSNEPLLTGGATSQGLAKISQKFLDSTQFCDMYNQVFHTEIWPGLYYTVWKSN